VLATLIGFALGGLFGFVAGYLRGSWMDKAASLTAVLGVSVPHYWLGMVLVIVFSVILGWLPPGGAGPSGSGTQWAWDWEHVQPPGAAGGHDERHPDGHHRAHRARAGRRHPVAGIRRSACAPSGLTEVGVFRHVVKNAAPTALAVMGLQLGYLLGGSILIETVFSWPGTGFLLNSAIFQRDLPLLQGTILVLACSSSC
jgi:peptide/nickel transport system permease protein